MEAFVLNEGLRIWTTSRGTGTPVLLCNGGPGCCDYLAPVAQMLEGAAQVIRFEQRGCGRSEGGPPYDLEGCLSDLEAVRHHYGLSRWIIGGHSWGADLALLYTLRYPENTLGFICLSGGRVHNDRDWHRIYTEKQEQGLEMLPPFDYPPNQEVNQQVNRAWKMFIKRPTLLKEIATLERPALFLYGDQDIRPSWPIEQVAALLPNARMELFSGADHFPWNTHSEQMKSLLTGFVRSLANT